MIQQVPTEILVEILSELPTQKLRKCAFVCQFWYDLINTSNASLDYTSELEENDIWSLYSSSQSRTETSDTSSDDDDNDELSCKTEKDEFTPSNKRRIPLKSLSRRKKLRTSYIEYSVWKRRAEKYFSRWLLILPRHKELTRDCYWLCRACDNVLDHETIKKGFSGFAHVKGIQSNVLYAARNHDNLKQCSLEYVGELKNGHYHGVGMIRTPLDYASLKGRQDYYTGLWKNGRPHGWGVFSWSNGSSWYKGECKLGMRHGYGEFVWTDGRRYIGNFKRDHMWGSGTYFWNEGYVEGQWKLDEMHGKCKLLYKNGTTFVGKYRYGVRNGKGVYTWPDGSVYEGHYKNHNRHGQGVMKFSNGLTYEGSFLDDERHGQGKLSWINGDFFEGNWVRGRRLGLGIFYEKETNRSIFQTWNEQSTSYCNGAKKWPLCSRV